MKLLQGSMGVEGEHGDMGSPGAVVSNWDIWELNYYAMIYFMWYIVTEVFVSSLFRGEEDAPESQGAREHPEEWYELDGHRAWRL